MKNSRSLKQSKIKFLKYFTEMSLKIGRPNVQYKNNPAVKKWLPFDLICTVDLEYILTFNIAPKITAISFSNIVLY